jgi:hypothetical protein
MITIRLNHMPPPLSALFTNIPRRGRVKTERYRVWLRAVEYDMLPFRKLRITEPVQLTIVLGKLRKNADISNRIKACEDLIVSYGIIPDDSSEWVKCIRAGVAKDPFDGVIIHIGKPIEAFRRNATAMERAA